MSFLNNILPSEINNKIFKMIFELNNNKVIHELKHKDYENVIKELKYKKLFNDIEKISLKANQIQSLISSNEYYEYSIPINYRLKIYILTNNAMMLYENNKSKIYELFKIYKTINYYRMGIIIVFLRVCHAYHKFIYKYVDVYYSKKSLLNNLKKINFPKPNDISDYLYDAEFTICLDKYSMDPDEYNYF